jgi:hypothetical protein
MFKRKYNGFQEQVTYYHYQCPVGNPNPCRVATVVKVNRELDKIQVAFGRFRNLIKAGMGFCRPFA